MQEQLLNELRVLAERLIALDNNTNVATLKNEAKQLYEKLTVLDFVSHNIQSFQTPKVENTIVKQETSQVEQIKKQEVVVETPIQEVVVQKIEVKEPIVEKSVQEPVKPIVETPKQETPKSVDINTYLSNDDVDTIFDQNQWEIKDPAQKSLNRKLKPETITVGLNDRIAFVNHLFNFSQSDFNRVLSQLNTIENEQAAYDFINKMVKPEYDWAGQEEYEQRLLDLIARRFS